MPSEETDSDPKDGPSWFTNTHWSIIMKAGSGMLEAQNQLCLTYWNAIYRFICRSGFSGHDAEDLTQGFFAELQKSNFYLGADPSKGRFRSLLLACLKHFLAKHRRSNNAQKRGGEHPHVSIDDDGDSGHPLQLPAQTPTPEEEFDREWAIALQTQALKELQAKFTSNGEPELFDALKAFLAVDRPESTYAELAPKLGMTPAALKQKVHRLRKDWRDIWLRVVSSTVPPADVEDELRALFKALCR